MSPTLPSQKDIVSINIEALSFILEMNEPNILGELSVEESKYQRVIEAIEERTRIHRDEAQPLLEKAGIKAGSIHSFKEIEDALGERLYTTLQQSTSQIIGFVDDTIVGLQSVGNELSQNIQEMYPKEKMLKISILGQDDKDKP